MKKDDLPWEKYTFNSQREPGNWFFYKDWHCPEGWPKGYFIPEQEARDLWELKKENATLVAERNRLRKTLDYIENSEVWAGKICLHCGEMIGRSYEIIKIAKEALKDE